MIVSPAGDSVELEALHDGHPRLTKMKQLARSIVCCPGIDKDLENNVRQCEQCALAQKSPTHIPLHPWEWPDCPWAILISTMQDHSWERCFSY